MYGQMPYMFPGSFVQASTQITNGLAGTNALGNALGSTKAGIGSFFSKINWSSILSNTQKTLNVVNQAIPLYYQAKPVFKNIKALGKIGREFTKIGTNNTSKENSSQKVQTQETSSIEENTQNIPEPTFFL